MNIRNVTYILCIVFQYSRLIWIYSPSRYTLGTSKPIDNISGSNETNKVLLVRKVVIPSITESVTRNAMSCKSCKFCTSLRSGIILKNSNIPFLLGTGLFFDEYETKKGFSTKEIQRHLGLKCYEPVWAMVHKLRKLISIVAW